MGIRRRGGSSKNPPIFSHEFVIQNHADIVSCVAMVILLGLMFQVSSPLASVFVAMQYNVTTNNKSAPEVEASEQVKDKEPEEGVDLEINYYNGPLDMCGVFFYLLICIVVHAVVQEYVLDKLNRKLHLSKMKHSKFNESGQLIAFYLFSVAWGIDVMMREGYSENLSHLWEKYPHALLSFRFKFYFIIQMAYWLHILPELYFQKVKKEEIGSRVRYAAFYVAFICAAYLLNLTRLTLLCMVVHYVAEMAFHLARLLYFSEKTELSEPCFSLWALLFLLARLTLVTLTVLVVWFGLGKVEPQGIDLSKGNYNSPLVRISVLAAVCLFQAWLLWNFLTFQLKRRREAQAAAPKKKSNFGKDKKKTKKDESAKKAKQESSDDGGDGDSMAITNSENGGMRTRSKTPKKK